MRPDASVSGTRCTRCTPDSNLSLANTPRPLHLGDDFLEAAFRAFADRHDFGLPALLGGVALVHAEQVAGEQRGLVAAGAGADFEDGVVVVHRVLRQQRELDLLLELVASLLQFAGFSASAILRISASVDGIVDQRIEVGESRPSAAR